MYTRKLQWTHNKEAIDQTSLIDRARIFQDDKGSLAESTSFFIGQARSLSDDVRARYILLLSCTRELNFVKCFSSANSIRILSSIIANFGNVILPPVMR